MTVDQELVDAAIAQARRRYPSGEGGAAAVRTASGAVFTSVGFDNIHPGAMLCHETGAILQAYTRNDAVTASVCVTRLGTDVTPIILPPCGICRERLALWGPDVAVAVPAEDPTVWRSRRLSQVHLSYWGRQFPEESGWPGGWG